LRLLGRRGFEVQLPRLFLKSIGEAASRDVVIGVRPEHVEIVYNPQEDVPRGQVFMMEPLGRDTLVDVRCGDQAVRALVPGDLALEVGQTVGLRVSPEAIHLFDAKTERRLPDPDVSAAARAVAWAGLKGA